MYIKLNLRYEIVYFYISLFNCCYIFKFLDMYFYFYKLKIINLKS